MKGSEILGQVRESVASDFRCPAHGGCVTVTETLAGGRTYTFELKTTAPAVVFTLDVRGGKKPFGVFNEGVAGLTAKCDLIVVTITDEPNARPVVFVIEVKSSNRKGAQKQLNAGASFVHYLFDLLRVTEPRIPEPTVLSVLVHTAPKPPMGTTKPPSLAFVAVGRKGLLRTEWNRDVPLSLLSLRKAAVAGGHV